MKKSFLALCLVVLMLVGSLPAGASIAAMEKEDILKETPIIVHGTVMELETQYKAEEDDPYRDYIVTEYSVHVDRVYKGKCPSIIIVKLINKFETTAPDGSTMWESVSRPNFSLAVGNDAIMLLAPIEEEGYENYYLSKTGYSFLFGGSGYFTLGKDGLYHSGPGHYSNTIDLATFDEEAIAAGGAPYEAGEGVLNSESSGYIGAGPDANGTRIDGVYSVTADDEPPYNWAAMIAVPLASLAVIIAIVLFALLRKKKDK